MIYKSIYFKARNIDNNNNGNNVNNVNNVGGMTCHNNLKHVGYIASLQRNVRQTETKTGLLQIFNANHFAGLDHEDPYTHLKNFYDIYGTLGTLETEDEAVFLRLFPYSLIGKGNEWYLDQSILTMTN